MNLTEQMHCKQPHKMNIFFKYLNGFWVLFSFISPVHKKCMTNYTGEIKYILQQTFKLWRSLNGKG